jgi:hypothetical protein
MKLLPLFQEQWVHGFPGLFPVTLEATRGGMTAILSDVVFAGSV